MIKYTNKVEAAGKEYDALNEKIKNDMITTKETHDDLIETMLVTFVCAQVCCLVPLYSGLYYR